MRNKQRRFPTSRESGAFGFTIFCFKSDQTPLLPRELMLIGGTPLNTA